MDCPRCGAHNETDVGSCLSCGAPMEEESESLPTIAQKPVAPPPSGSAGKGRLAAGAPPKQCPNCMTLNAATFKFCARCGTPLGATGPSVQPQPTPAKSAPARPPAAAAAKPAAPAKPAAKPAAAAPKAPAGL